MKTVVTLFLFFTIAFSSCKKEMIENIETNTAASVRTAAQDASVNPNNVNAVLFNSNHTIYAFQPATGKLLWSKAQSGIGAIPVLYNNRLFFNSEINVYALDAATGNQLWKSDNVGQSFSALCAYNNKIYVTVKKKIICLSAADGSIIWTFTQPYTGSLSYPYSAPTVVNGTLYVGGNDEATEYALDAETGAQKWKYINASKSPVCSSPCVYQNKVYNIDRNGVCFALDTASGATVWSQRKGVNFYSSPTVSNGRLYISGGDLFCVNPANGNDIWRFSDTSTEIHRTTTAECFVDGDKVFAPIFEHFYSLQTSNGSINWYSLLERTDCGMTEANGILYFQGYYSNYFFAVDAATGSVLWTYLLDGNIPTTGVIVSARGKVTYPVRSGMVQ